MQVPVPVILTENYSDIGAYGEGGVSTGFLGYHFAVYCLVVDSYCLIFAEGGQGGLRFFLDFVSHRALCLISIADLLIFSEKLSYSLENILFFCFSLIFFFFQILESAYMPT